jgi:hypothetical protein
VDQASERDGELGIVIGALLLADEGRLDAGIVEECEEGEGVEGGDPHVDRAVVIVAEADDGDVIGGFLESVEFAIGKEFLHDTANPASDSGHEGSIEFLSLDG